MADGYDQTKSYLRQFPTKDWEGAHFARDDFTGISLDTTHRWSITHTNGGSHSFLNDTPNGVLEIQTDNNVGDSGILKKNDIKIVSPLLFPLIGIRAKVPDISDTDFEMRLGFVDVLGTDDCIFEVDATAHGALNIFAVSHSGGGAATQSEDTGINLNADWRIFEIAINSDGKPFWKIEGVYEVEGDDADVNPAEYLQPYAEIKIEDAVARALQLDFIFGMQKRE